MEIWKNIIGYEQYQISNHGRVKTTANEAKKKERILKLLKHPRGYFRVALWKNNKSKFFFTVAFTYKSNIFKIIFVSHIMSSRRLIPFFSR